MYYVLLGLESVLGVPGIASHLIHHRGPGWSCTNDQWVAATCLNLLGYRPINWIA